jgi:hypothetical protein
MASTTGIELGRESCVLAGVRPSQTGIADVVALHTIESGAWPTLDVAFVESLRGLRRGKGFPRNARIVAWGLPDDPAGDDTTARWLQRPILAAGFRVESIVTPPQALALLAASRPRPFGSGAVVWLALNIQAAAIAIVHDGELLFARTFEWSYSTGNTSGKAQLLQRYSLVAQLAPEVRRGIAAVLESRGLAVEQAVTCGDLPDLRSLTMPLIEELDVEVETLDSTEGLRAVGKARTERFAEAAPAIRLACAVALAPSKSRGSATRSVARVAAALGVIAVLGWGSYALWRAPVSNAANTPRPSASRPAGSGTTGPAAGVPAEAPGRPQVKTQGPAVTKPAVVPPSAAATPPVAPPRVAGDPQVGQPAARPGAPGPLAQVVPPKPVGTPPGTPIATAPKVDPKPAGAGPVSAGLETALPIVKAPAKVESKPAATPPSTARVETPPPVATASAKKEPIAPHPGVTSPARVVTPPRNPPAMRAEPPVAAGSPGPAVRFDPGAPPTFQLPARNSALRTVEHGAPAPGRPLPPLEDPLPKVDSILIDQDRRLAIVDGTIVSIGDPVGARVVVQIDRDGVILREPSGLSVRVALRAKTIL